LGDGVFDPNLRETRGDDHQLGLEMGAGSDRGVEVTRYLEAVPSTRKRALDEIDSIVFELDE
jgi:hypothetical protein